MELLKINKCHSPDVLWFFLFIFLQDVDDDFRQMIWKNQQIHTDAVQQLGCYSEFGQTIGGCTRLIESGKKNKKCIKLDF